MAPSLAQAAGPQLTWHAPPACPDRVSVQAALARTLPANVDLAALTAVAEVTAVADGYRLELTIETPSAHSARELVAERCDTLVEVVALELSMTSASMPPIAKRTLAWGVRALGGVGTGPAPEPSPRVALLGTLQRRRLRVELGLAYDTPRTRHYDAQPAVGARISALSGQLRACDALPLAQVELSLCGGGEAGALRGEGLGVDSATTATRAWTALLAGAGLRYPRRSWIAVFAGLDGVLALSRPRFGIRNLSVLYRPARVSVRGALGVELHFD